MNGEGSNCGRWKLNQSLFWVKQESLEFFQVLSSEMTLQDLFCSFLEDGRMPHTSTLLQITAYWLSTSSWVLFPRAEAHVSFCLTWAQAFPLTPFHPFFISVYFFCEVFCSQLLLCHCFPPIFISTYLIIGGYLPLARKFCSIYLLPKISWLNLDFAYLSAKGSWS